jgi:hypothetical protein
MTQFISPRLLELLESKGGFKSDAQRKAVFAKKGQAAKAAGAVFKKVAKGSGFLRLKSGTEVQAYDNADLGKYKEGLLKPGSSVRKRVASLLRDARSKSWEHTGYSTNSSGKDRRDNFSKLVERGKRRRGETTGDWAHISKEVSSKPSKIRRTVTLK